MIYEHERIDDLQIKGLQLIQNPSLFCFGMDAVLLASYAKIKKGVKVVDLGTGNGIIPVLLCGKYQPKQVVGIELQVKSASLANRNVTLNNLEKQISIIEGDVRDIKSFLKPQSAQIVICNPPYKKAKSGMINEQAEKAIAKHELNGALEDFIKAASYILNDNGQVHMINRPERLVDTVMLMRQYQIEPKKITFVLPYHDQKPNLFLITGRKHGKPFLSVEKNLVIREKNGEYTKELLEMYK
ncbi:MAG: tRNA1(Val) (adenine(37)-N6)-methyltransferase [Clostridiales bacterium]|nr:tRNA1(Val) (adenine(37)-N6)-methyltransferase [Clostridiales bacterium]